MSSIYLRPCWLLFSLFLPFASWAQQLSAPHDSVRPKMSYKVAQKDPAVTRSVVGGVWRTDATTKSILTLTNRLSDEPLELSPVLFLANGKQVKLAPLSIAPKGMIVVDINQALATHNIAPYASLSGYVEVSYTWHWDVLTGTIRNTDTAHSTIFTYDLRARALPSSDSDGMDVLHSASGQGQTLEGMWWKETTGTTAFLSFANPSDEAASIRISVSDDTNEIGQHAVTLSPRETVKLDLAEVEQARTDKGSVSIQIAGGGRRVIAQGGLLDQQTGYSADLPMTYKGPSTGSVSESSPADLSHTIAQVGLMVGSADPTMRFPAGTTFMPYSIIHNTSAAVVTVIPTIYWVDHSRSVSAQLEAVSISPGRTQRLDLEGMMTRAGVTGLNGLLTLALRSPAASSLLIAGGSIDQKKTYVFGVTPDELRVSASRVITRWSTMSDEDTMLSFWNPTDEAQDLDLKLFYAGGQYHIPVSLPAKATRNINLAVIAHTHLPDADGNVIPFNVSEGSAQITGLKGVHQRFLIAMDASVFSVRKATCGRVTIYCDGVVNALPEQSALGLASGDAIQQTMAGQWTDGSQIDETTNTYWRTNDPSIASIDSVQGLVQWQSDGNSSLQGNFRDLKGGDNVESDVPNNIPYCGNQKMFVGGFPGMPPIATCTCDNVAGPDSVGSCGYSCQCKAAPSSPPYQDTNTFQRSYMAKQPTCAGLAPGRCPVRIKSYNTNLKGLSFNTFGACLQVNAN